MLISPKEIEVNGKTFIISKFPAVAGREIVSVYVSSGMPKLGDYKRNEEIMLKLMGYVAVPMASGTPLRLTSQALIDNHVTGEDSWEMLMKLEAEVMSYNCSFFRNGQISNFFDGLTQKAPRWISKILTDLSGQLSQTEKPRSTN